MKWLITILVILSMTLIWGCGGDDDDGGGTDPVVGPPRIQVTTSTAGYVLNDPQASDWGLVDSATIEVSMGNPPAKINPSLAAVVTNAVKVKAATRDDSLFILLEWVDNSYDVWPNNWNITQITPGLAYDSALFDREDQLYVMFNGGSSFGWDVWNWRVITTGAGSMAEGMLWNSSTLTTDADGNVSGLKVALRNKKAGFNQPEFVHEDTSEHIDPVLFLTDAISTNYDIEREFDTVKWYQTTGWQVDQKIQGWLIDNSVSGRSEADRGSRWDIGAYSAYQSGVYSVVLAGKLNTGYEDDLNLSTLDSVKVQLGVLNDQDKFHAGTSDRGFSEDFWLIF